MLPQEPPRMMRTDLLEQTAELGPPAQRAECEAGASGVGRTDVVQRQGAPHRMNRPGWGGGRCGPWYLAKS